MADERPQLPDFYQVLGVGFDASNDELRRAWRAAVKQWHPDTNRSPEAHSMMARINEAWEVLGNPERRAEYDTLYFTLRAALANEERKQREEERLERQRRERLRQQEAERKRRAEEEARKRKIAEEERRAQQERREREQRERERREAEARRKAELERKQREQQRIDKEAKDREESAVQPSASGGPSRRTGTGGRAVTLWLALVLVAVAVAIAWLVFDWSDGREVGPEPVIIYVTATAAPLPTPTLNPTLIFVTATPTRTPTPVPTGTPRPTVTPTAIPRPEQEVGFIKRIRPGSVHEYLLAADSDSDADVVRRLINSGAEFGYINEIGFGTLFIAAAVGAESDVFAALLDAGDDPTRVPDLLHALLWSENPSLDSVQTLIDAGASLRFRDFAGRNPADIANSRASVSYRISEVLEAATVKDVRIPPPMPSSARSGNFDGAESILHSILSGASRNWIGSLNSLIYLGAPLNTTDFEGKTVLEAAAYWGRDSEVFDLLISAGADLSRSTTVLHELLGGIGSLVGPSVDSLRSLIDAGAPVNTKDDMGRTVLDIAESKGLSAEVSAMLISAGAVPSRTQSLPTETVPPRPTATPLPRFQGSPTVLHRLLDNLSFQVSVGQVRSLVDAGAPVNVKDRSGRSVLDVAASRAHTAGVLLTLTSAGADASRSPTVLHRLLDNLSFQVGADQVRVLINAGAPVNTKDSSGRSVLDVAAARAHSSDVLSMLTSAGADASRSPTVLHRLLGNLSFQVGADQVRVLIGAGAPLNSKDRSGRSVLDVAAARAHSVGVLSTLTSAGADASRSPTVLHSLLGNLSFQVGVDQVRVLINAGAPTNSRDRAGRTPLDVAVSRSHSPEIIDLLVP